MLNRQYHFATLRAHMIADLQRVGITDEQVLAAMQQIERESFLPPRLWSQAYADQALPIGFNQTISQPKVAALLCQLAQLQSNTKVLEIGTGTGYQTALLASIVSEVVSIEIVPQLAKRARHRLRRSDARNCKVITGNALLGSILDAPFDRIVCAAAIQELPPAWIDQLSPGGVIVAAIITPQAQCIKRVTKSNSSKLEWEEFESISLAPLTNPSNNQGH